MLGGGGEGGGGPIIKEGPTLVASLLGNASKLLDVLPHRPQRRERQQKQCLPFGQPDCLAPCVAIFTNKGPPKPSTPKPLNTIVHVIGAPKTVALIWTTSRIACISLWCNVMSMMASHEIPCPCDM